MLCYNWTSYHCTLQCSFLSRSSTSWKVSRKSWSLSAPSGRSSSRSLHSVLWVRCLAAPLAVHCWLSAGGFLSPEHKSRGWATAWANPRAAAAARQGSCFSIHTQRATGETNVLGNKAVLRFINADSGFHKWKQTSWPVCLCHMALSWWWTLLWETYSPSQWEPGEWERTSLHLSEEKGWGLGRGHQRNRKVPASKKITHSSPNSERKDNTMAIFAKVTM